MKVIILQLEDMSLLPKNSNMKDLESLLNRIDKLNEELHD